jgi:hypothetical protein
MRSQDCTSHGRAGNCVAVTLRRAIRLEPEDLEELGGLRRDADRQVLRAVELSPVALVGEPGDRGLQLFNRRDVVRHASSGRHLPQVGSARQRAERAASSVLSDGVEARDVDF